MLAARAFAMGLPGATEDFPWGERVVKAGGKDFVFLGKDEGEEALKEPHVKEFDITGRPMRNWVLVGPEGVEDDERLSAWIRRAVKFVGALPAKEK